MNDNLKGGVPLCGAPTNISNTTNNTSRIIKLHIEQALCKDCFAIWTDD